MAGNRVSDELAQAGRSMLGIQIVPRGDALHHFIPPSGHSSDVVLLSRHVLAGSFCTFLE